MERRTKTSGVSLESSKYSRDSLYDDPEKDDLEKYLIQDEPALVVIPVDFSPHSENCLSYYIRYIHKIGNKVHVVYVAEQYAKKADSAFDIQRKLRTRRKSSLDSQGREEEPFAPKDDIIDDEDDSLESRTRRLCPCLPKSKVMVEVEASPGVLTELEIADKKKCSAFKRKVKKYFRSNGVLFEFHRLISNDAARAIVMFSRIAEASLIVMGSRGLGNVKETLMGSISRKVVRSALIPVLVVKNLPVPKKKKETVIN